MEKEPMDNPKLPANQSRQKPTDPLTPYGNRPMVTPIVNAVNYTVRLSVGIEPVDDLLKDLDQALRHIKKGGLS